jgi:GrpB-like predicted nucleotidyltransferase (UPF0157 family)
LEKPSHTDEQIRAYTVGELQPLKGRIVLADYDPRWPQHFLAEAQELRAALSERALMIEHVGSTAVPALLAKPIIDMILVVANSADERAYVPDLESAGYVLRIREPDWYEHRVFKGPRANINLHVFSANCTEVARMLAFRDWLREHDADRHLYANAKRTLAQQTWRYVQNYADAKTAVIEEIIARAIRARLHGPSVQAPCEPGGCQHQRRDRDPEDDLPR